MLDGGLGPDLSACCSLSPKAAAAAACLGALAALIWRTVLDDPARLWVLGGMLGLAVLIEVGYRFVGGRVLNLFEK